MLGHFVPHFSPTFQLLAEVYAALCIVTIVNKLK